MTILVIPFFAAAPRAGYGRIANAVKQRRSNRIRRDRLSRMDNRLRRDVGLPPLPGDPAVELWNKARASF